MAGTPGTPRFGAMADQTPSETNSSGTSSMTLQKSGGTFTEYHFSYNPAQRSREMGTTRGADPGQQFDSVEHQSNYMCNHDAFMGGNNVVSNLDERKVLHNTIYSQSFEIAEDSSNGWAPHQTMGAFD